MMPDKLIIVGGIHPSLDPIGVLEKYQQIDISVYGEGELTVKELLDVIGNSTEKINATNIDRIKGIKETIQKTFIRTY